MPELTPQIINIRIFLAGFMIEHALLEAATQLISSFEKIMDAIKRAGATGSFHDVPSDLTKEFPTLLFKYLKAFKAWKVPDEAKLTNSITNQASASRAVSGGGAGGGGGGGGVGGAYAALQGFMTNDQLAHELLLDPMFQLDESGGCSVENPAFHCISESFHQVRMCVFCLLFGAWFVLG